MGGPDAAAQQQQREENQQRETEMKRSMLSQILDQSARARCKLMSRWYTNEQECFIAIISVEISDKYIKIRTIL